MSEIKTISSNETDAPVVTEWRKFIFNGEECDNWPIFAGVDKDGNIWLQLKNISEAVSMESCSTLTEAEFDELVRKLPDRMSREIQWRLPKVQNGQYITAIAPSGLLTVTQALIKDSSQPEQAKKATSRFWDWFMYVVYPELNGLANKAKAQPEAEILPHEDLPEEISQKKISQKKISHEFSPDEVPEAAARPPYMVKQRSFTFTDKYNIRVGIDEDDEIWLARVDVLNILTADIPSEGVCMLWIPILAKLSSKQHKEIMLRKDDQLEYYRVWALNISGLFAVIKALLDNPAEPVNAAANKLWH
ncbi:MAG: hypothetical protein IJ667_11730 [Synergistaceae bacterium]|nr:hypothetical protein [Synergistaceae bacterium]